MDSINNSIVELFSVKQIEYKNKNDATVTRDEQSRKWTKILSKISRRFANWPYDVMKEWSASINEISNIITNHEQEFFLIQQTQNGHTVHGRIPLLLKDADAYTDYINNYPWEFMAAIVYETSMAIWDKLQQNSNNKTALDVFSIIPFDAHLKEYIYFKLSRETNRSEEINKLIELSINKSNYLDDTLENQKKEISLNTNNIIKIIDDSKNEWSTFFEKSKDDHKAAIATLIGKETLKSATKTWTNKVWMHRAAFFGGLLILVFLAIVAFWYLSNHFDRVQDFIEDMKKPDGDIPYGIVLFCLVPVVAVGWLLRFIGKWIVNALALGADAQHRVALLETYFRLLADPNNKMDPTERGIVLAALFRPVPGQESSDDVQPPSLLELIKGKPEK